MSKVNKKWWQIDETEQKILKKKVGCIYMVVMNNLYTISIDLLGAGILMYILAKLFGVTGSIKKLFTDFQWLGKMILIVCMLLAILNLICVIVSVILKLWHYIAESGFVIIGSIMFGYFPFYALWKVTIWNAQDKYYLLWILALVMVYIFWWGFKRLRFLSEAQVKSDSDSLTLILYKNDKIYVPQLLAQIENPELRKRAANEMYSYVYGAARNKALYLGLMFLSITFPATVAALNGQDIFKGKTSIIVTLFSLLAAVVSGLLGLLKAKEAWVRYREFSERTKEEIVSYVLGIKKYAGKSKTAQNGTLSDADMLLAENLENLYAEEGGRWKDLHDSYAEEAITRGIIVKEDKIVH